MKSKRVPQIRFKGFVGEWEIRKLGDLTEFINGRAYKQDELLTEGKYRVLRVGNFYTNSEWYYSNLELGEKYYADNNDLLYTWSATFGPHIWVGEKVIFHYHIWKLNLSHLIDRNFTVQLLENDKARMGGTNGSTMLHITKKGMEEKLVSIPKVKEEQTKIGNFFKQFDDTIALYQQELNKLKETKQGFLQKMFPKEGESVPEIRFSGFKREWKRENLQNICEHLEYGLNAAAIKYDGKNKYIRITDIDDDSRHFLTNNISSPDVDITNVGRYLLNEGDILLARTGASVGKSYHYKAKDGLVYFAGFLIRARINETNNSEFVYQNTFTDNYKKYITILSQRSGQPGVNAQEYGRFSLFVPSLREQTLIGNFFKKLDDLIALKERELEAVKQTKKAFLQKMFI